MIHIDICFEHCCVPWHCSILSPVSKYMYTCTICISYTGRLTAHDIAAFARDSSENSVTVLGPNDFPARVVESEERWIVDFYAPVSVDPAPFLPFPNSVLSAFSHPYIFPPPFPIPFRLEFSDSPRAKWFPRSCCWKRGTLDCRLLCSSKLEKRNTTLSPILPGPKFNHPPIHPDIREFTLSESLTLFLGAIDFSGHSQMDCRLLCSSNKWSENSPCTLHTMQL